MIVHDQPNTSQCETVKPTSIHGTPPPEEPPNSNTLGLTDISYMYIQHLEALCVEAGIDLPDAVEKKSNKNKDWTRKSYIWTPKPFNRDGFNLVRHIPEDKIDELLVLEERAVKLFHRNPWLVNSYRELATALATTRENAKQIIRKFIAMEIILKKNNFYLKKDGSDSKKYKRNYYRLTAIGKKYLWLVVKKVKEFTRLYTKRSSIEEECLLNPKQLKNPIRNFLSEAGYACFSKDPPFRNFLRRKKDIHLVSKTPNKDTAVPISSEAYVDNDMYKELEKNERGSRVDRLKNALAMTLFKSLGKDDVIGVARFKKTLLDSNNFSEKIKTECLQISRLIDAFAKYGLLPEMLDLKLQQLFSLLSGDTDKLEEALQHIRGKLDEDWKPRSFLAYLRSSLKTDGKITGFRRKLARELRDAISGKDVAGMRGVSTRECVESIASLELKSGLVATEKQLMDMLRGKDGFSKLRNALQFTEDRGKKCAVTKSWIDMTFFALKGVKDRYARKDGSKYYKGQASAVAGGARVANHVTNNLWLNGETATKINPIGSTGQLKSTQYPEKTHVLVKRNVDEMPHKTLVEFFKLIRGKWQRLGIYLGDGKFIEKATAMLEY